jgi:hypothetical protein
MSRFLRNSVSFLFLAVCASGSTGRPMLIVSERTQRASMGTLNCEGKLSVSRSLSSITFFDDGEVTKLAWTAPACSDPAKAWVWTPPAGTRVRRSKLQAGDRDVLQRFLDLPEVKALTDFMNEGPGVGDYQIEIQRASGIQKISVRSLMPEHDQLRHDRTLLRVIGRAKEMGVASALVGARLCPFDCPSCRSPIGALPGYVGRKSLARNNPRQSS